jgi:antitoxin CptB
MMSGSTRTSADLDERRRRALFRAWHRGIREMDLIMGRFADAEIGTMSDADLADLERLIEVPDPDLYAWIAGEEATPPDHDTPVFRRLKSFHAHNAPIHS